MKIRILRRIIFVMSMTAAFISGSHLALYEADSKSGEAEYKSLKGREKKEIKIIRTDGEKNKKNTERLFLPDIKEEELAGINEEYAAWLYIPGACINYPVVYSGNNTEYLKKTFEGKKRSCGCLFFDENTEPFVSLNTVIHGHNMKSGAMFGILDSYFDEKYREGRQKLYILFKGKWKEYTMCAIYKTALTDTEPYKCRFRTKKDFDSWADARTDLSQVKLCVSKGADEMLTLSTCDEEGMKLIIHFTKSGGDKETEGGNEKNCNNSYAVYAFTDSRRTLARRSV